MREQLGELGGLQHEPRHTLQGNVGAVVVRDDLRLDAGTGSVRSRVHVGDETHDRDLPVDIGGNGAHHIAPLVEGRLDAQGLQLVPQHAQEVQLFLGGGLALALFIGLGVHCDIAQKTVKYLFHKRKDTKKASLYVRIFRYI